MVALGRRLANSALHLTSRRHHDIGVAEELAQYALVTALELRPEEGIPENPGATFTIREGPKVVGYGEVKRVLLPDA